MIDLDITGPLSFFLGVMMCAIVVIGLKGEDGE